MSGAEFILRKLLFGQRAEPQNGSPPRIDHRAPAPPAALPGGVSGGEDFRAGDKETA